MTIDDTEQHGDIKKAKLRNKEKIMTPELMLAKNLQFKLSEVVVFTDARNSEMSNIGIDAVKQLVPKRACSFMMQAQEKPSYKLIALVLLAHLLAFAGMYSSKSEVKVARQQTTISVSLLGNAEPVTKAEPKQITQQPTLQQQAAKPKQHVPFNDHAVKEAVVEASQDKSQHVDPQPHVNESVATVTEPYAVEKLANAAPAVTDEVELVTEAPKFGAAYLQNPAPDYPSLARRKGEQGRVLLQVLVSETGKAEKVQIDTGSGYSSLDQAALEAVKKWSFIPAKKGNRPVSAYVIVPVRFSLNG